MKIKDRVIVWVVSSFMVMYSCDDPSTSRRQNMGINDSVESSRSMTHTDQNVMIEPDQTMTSDMERDRTDIASFDMEIKTFFQMPRSI